MGSHSSSTVDINQSKEKKSLSKMIDSGNLIELNNFSNESNRSADVKMETSDNNKSVSARSTSKETMEKGSEVQDMRIPTLFEWNGGGKMAFITGSFCGWSQKFPMAEIETGRFKLILNLPKGFYQYKFIIDDQWRYSNQLPLYKDELGNINNYIDNTSNAIDSKGDNDNPSHSLSPYHNQPHQHHHQQNTNNKQLMDFFSNTFPSKMQLNTDSPVVPSQYGKLLNLNYNTNQPFIGEMSFIPRKIDLLTENNASTSITFPSHVILNHLFTKIKRKRYIKTCGTLRVRAKFSTFIYIKPM